MSVCALVDQSETGQGATVLVIVALSSGIPIHHNERSNYSIMLIEELIELFILVNFNEIKSNCGTVSKLSAQIQNQHFRPLIRLLIAFRVLCVRRTAS